jgi:signal transduction histidine kinase
MLVPGLALALAVVAALGDRALVGQAAAERSAAALQLDEDARVTVVAVSAALSQVEQDLLAGARLADAIDVERLALPPSRSVPSLGSVPYAKRSRAELVQLLSSRLATPSGLPEAVVARLALGPATPISGAPAERPVEERLLDGELPVRPEDLPFLARRLGLPADARLRALEKRLRRAPDAADLPRAPGFRRRLTNKETIEGWTRTRRSLARYALPAGLLLQRAGVTERAVVVPVTAGQRQQGPASKTGLDRLVDVPDVPGLTLRIGPRMSSGLRLVVLRAVLWLSAAAGILGLLGLRRALAREARAASRERAFLAGVTHELRTPLTAIRVFGETLADGRGDPREYGNLVAQESHRLEGLVERVLTLTRVDQAPHFESADPAELLRDAVALVEPRASRRSTRIECNVDDGLPRCWWDAEALRRALLNLLDNAIRHGREGGRILATASRDGGDVRLSIADDGPGIGRSERGRVFGRFERGRAESGGTGLGLYLVEQVARAHGGRVDLVTEEGRGSVFSLVLPQRPPASSPEPSP